MPAHLAVPAAYCCGAFTLCPDDCFSTNPNQIENELTNDDDNNNDSNDGDDKENHNQSPSSDNNNNTNNNKRNPPQWILPNDSDSIDNRNQLSSRSVMMMTGRRTASSAHGGGTSGNKTQKLWKTTAYRQSSTVYRHSAEDVVQQKGSVDGIEAQRSSVDGTKVDVDDDDDDDNDDHHHDDDGSTFPRSSLGSCPIPTGYIDGVFSRGRIKYLTTATAAAATTTSPVNNKKTASVVRFSPESSLLAVGLRTKGNGSGGSKGGVIIYETRTWGVRLELDRDGSVNALDWKRVVVVVSSMGLRQRVLLLAVGCSDGTVGVYIVSDEADQGGGGGGVVLWNDVTVNSPVGTLAFTPPIDNNTTNNTSEITSWLAVGRNDGHLSFLRLIIDPFNMSSSSSTSSSSIWWYTASSSSSIHGAQQHPPLTTLTVSSSSSSSSSLTCDQNHLIALGYRDGLVKIHRLSTTIDGNNTLLQTLGRKIQEIKMSGEITSLAFSVDLKQLAMGGYDKYVAIVDTTVWQVVRKLKQDTMINEIVYDPSGKFLAIGSRDKFFTLYDTSTLHKVKQLRSIGWIMSLSFGTHNHLGHIALREHIIGNKNKNINNNTFVTSSSPITILSLSTTQIIKSNLTTNHYYDDNGGGTTSHLKNHDVAVEDASSLSWSWDSRFLARADGEFVSVAEMMMIEGYDGGGGGVDDGEWRDVVQGDSGMKGGRVTGVAFCMAEGMRDHIAVVSHDGELIVYQLCKDSDDDYYLRLLCQRFVEKQLKTVEWSNDGSILALAGRQKNLHIISTSTYTPTTPPIPLEGNIWTISFIPNSTSHHLHSPNNNNSIDLLSSSSSGTMVVASGYNAIIFDQVDSNTYTPRVRIERPRLVRCTTTHPTQPLLAIGDGGNTVTITNLLEERTLSEFNVGGRVYSLDFSPCGGFLAVGSDECRVTIHETKSFRIVQEVGTSGWALRVKFARNGSYLAVDSSQGRFVSMVKLGPFFGMELYSLQSQNGIDDLPHWIVNEAIYRSVDGPSLLQRYMQAGSAESMRHAALILKRHPEAIYTFNRGTGEGCFETAMIQGKPALMKLVMTILVDGSLEAGENGVGGAMGRLLTTDLTEKGLETLFELIMNQPSDYVVEILAKLTYIKVPFTHARSCSLSDPLHCASHSFLDPWTQSSSPNPPHRQIPRSKGARHIPHHPPTSKNQQQHYHKGDVFRTPAVLPLPGLGSIRILSALTSESNNPKVFDNEAMGLVLKVMWMTYVRKYFYVDVFLYVCFYVLWVVFVDLTSQSTAPSNENIISSWGVYTLGGVVLALNTIFALKEMIQANWGKNRDYLRSWWNRIDFVSTIMVSTTVIVTFVRGGVGFGSVRLAVLTTLLLTAKLLSYLRGFKHTGWLISVLTQNFYDVRGFVIVLSAIIIGFTVAFRLLFGSVPGSCSLQLNESANVFEDDELTQECNAEPYGTLLRSLLATFEMTLLGSYEEGIFEKSQYWVLSIITFLLAVMIVLVVALNALIAVLSDSYSRVQQNATANLRKEKAELIVEYLMLLPRRKQREIERNSRYFHALLEADADGDLLVNSDDWQGGLNALRHDIDELHEFYSERMHRSMEHMKKDIELEISTIRSDVLNALSDVTKEMKQIKKMQSDGGVTFKGNNVVKAVKAVKNIGQNIRSFRIPSSHRADRGRRIDQGWDILSFDGEDYDAEEG